MAKLDRIPDSPMKNSFPEGIIRFYATALSVLHDLTAPEILLDGDDDILRFGLLAQYWSSVIGMKAEIHEPSASFLKLPGRAALIRALREGGGCSLLMAWDDCRRTGSLPEIDERYLATQRAALRTAADEDSDFDAE